jgi:hypothetical protein
MALNIAVVATPSAARTSRLNSAVSDRREQHEKDCNEVEGAPIDFDESDSSPPVWVWQQSPPSPLVEQWLSPIMLVGTVRHPDRQFNPPHQSKSRMAKEC